jgi:DNA-binding transcriptional MerR regulator
MHQIGQVAEAVGLSLRTIRHWEEVGLVLPSGRSAGGFRLYTDRDTARLRLVKRMKPLDFTLEEMREVLSLYDRLSCCSDPEDCSHARARLEEYAVVAEERCQALRSQLDGAREIARRLGAETGRPAAERGRR